MATDERHRTLLSNLGRATMRGVKKCPKCGTFNGSRGVCCKNKLCDAVFKEPGEKKKLSTETCKLITGTNLKIYSIPIKDKGQDHQGFVQLSEVNSSASSDLALQETALCFVDSCEKNFNTNILECNKLLSLPHCSHIRAAIQCNTEAQELVLSDSALSSLNLSNNIKQEIWFLASETSGPLVQRVSKSTMVVKCKISPKHPLGYLHFRLSSTKLKKNIHHKFSCSCSLDESASGVSTNFTDTTLEKQCVHFHACMWAFASDPKLSEEFQNFLNLHQPDSSEQESFDFQFNPNDPDIFVEMNLDPLSDDAHFLIFRDDSIVQSLQNDRLDIDNLNLDPSILIGDVIYGANDEDNHLLDNPNPVPQLNVSEVHNLEVMDQNVIFKGSTLKIIHNPATTDTEVNSNIDNPVFLNDNNDKSSNNAKIEIIDPVNFDINNMTLLETNHLIKNNNSKIIKIPSKCKTRSVKRKTINLTSFGTKKVKSKSLQATKKYLNDCEYFDESVTSLSFVTWLSSITERINQTMHFDYPEKPEPLIFQIPHAFFECLRERISGGSKKKRLPNSTTSIVRKDSVPSGTFTIHTWHITNILHLKSIFETKLVPLEITRSFSRKSDGTYEVLKREKTEMDRFRNVGNGGTIKPMELKTFLKVGITSPDQVQPTPFLIEWIPNILPISQVGELRLKFEFGHVTNLREK